MAKVEILTGADRQRRWSTEQKLSILQEAFSADRSVSDVARRHDVLPQQIYAWRKKFSPPKLKSPETVSFIPVSLIGASESPSDGATRSSLRSRRKDVEIVLSNGRLVRIAADMDLEVLSSLVARRLCGGGMIGPSGNVRVYLACGVTDMRRGIDGLSALVETTIKEAPGSGAIFGFRGRRADRIKLLWWDGQGFCLFYKILERGYFPWPTAKEGVAHLTQAQLSMLVEGIDWRRPAWTSAPGRTG